MQTFSLAGPPRDLQCQGAREEDPSSVFALSSRLRFAFKWAFTSSFRFHQMAAICKLKCFQNVWGATWVTFLGIRVSNVWWWKHSDNGHFPPHLTAKALSLTFLTFSFREDELQWSVDSLGHCLMEESPMGVTTGELDCTFKVKEGWPRKSKTKGD